MQLSRSDLFTQRQNIEMPRVEGLFVGVPVQTREAGELVSDIESEKTRAAPDDLRDLFHVKILPLPFLLTGEHPEIVDLAHPGGEIAGAAHPPGEKRKEEVKTDFFAKGDENLKVLKTKRQ